MKYSRLGLIGDIHAEPDSLEIALRCLEAAEVEHILCTGDVPDGAGDVDRCVELLEEHGVTTVRGNHERWFLHNTMRELPHITAQESVSAQTRRFLALLPPALALETVAGRLLLCHGVGENDMRRLSDDARYPIDDITELQTVLLGHHYRFMVGGHMHRRMVRRIEHLIVINAGTLLRGHDPCCAVADFARGWIQFYEIMDGKTIESERYELG